MKETFSTAQAMAKVGISKRTLERWVSAGLFKPPELLNVYGIRVRRWTPKDIERLRNLKHKLMASARPGVRLKGK